MIKNKEIEIFSPFPVLILKFILSYNFILYVEYKDKSIGAYRHSFGCTLIEAIRQWGCIKQILTFDRFYHSITDKSNLYYRGTKFNIFLFPIIYLYSIIDKQIYHKVRFYHDSIKI